MTELTFKIILKPHSPGHELAWVQHDSGVLRRASTEEVVLWEALEEARKRLEETEAPKRRK